jgi:hypothetical protein
VCVGDLILSEEIYAHLASQVECLRATP